MKIRTETRARATPRMSLRNGALGQALGQALCQVENLCSTKQAVC